MRYRYWQIFVVLLLFFLIYLQRGLFTLDPDFGWHIRVGEYILSHGIAYTDPFSYSMPSYLFVDHEWLTNIIWNVIYSKIGYWLLVVIYAVFAIAAICFQLVLTKKNWLLIPVFLTAGTFFDFMGVRTQVEDWLLLSILLIILWSTILWNRWRFFLPVLFLFWANTHGGFGIGIGVLGIVLVIKSFEEKKGWIENMLLIVACLIATLLNPFGIRLWGEFFSQLTDTQLRTSITEWYPAIYFSNLAFWFYAVVSLFLIIRYWKKYSWSELAVYILLFIAGISSSRNIPLWMIASFSLTVRGFTFLNNEASHFLYGKERFRIAYYGFFIIACILFVTQLGVYYYGEFLARGEGNGYPAYAVTYLQNHLPNGQIFSSYNWGGYLLWKLPEKKDFIDGRMPSWRWHLNSPKESNYAFSDYKLVLGDKIPFAPFAKKFDITTILASPEDLVKPKPVELLGIKLTDNSLARKLLFIGFNGSFYWVLQQVKQMGWKMVYQDKTAVIFEKNGIRG